MSIRNQDKTCSLVSKSRKCGTQDITSGTTDNAIKFGLKTSVEHEHKCSSSEVFFGGFELGFRNALKTQCGTLEIVRLFIGGISVVRVNSWIRIP